MNERGKFTALLLAGSLCTAVPGFAAETVDARVSRLEQELAELKTQVNTKSAVNPGQPEATKKAEFPSAPFVSTTSGTKIQFYGFTRFDASYDTGKLNTGNIALWVRPEHLNNHDAEWNLTAGATRLGLNLGGPDTETIKLTGNIEFDFLGGGTENNMNPRLRHGYLKAFWPAADFSILAGQTWDVHSSLIPFVDDPGLMWTSGNIGSRHPQLRLTKGFSTGTNGRVEVAVAAARTIGESNSWTDTWNVDTGKDAAMPTLQGRVAYSAPLLVKTQPATIGISGHYGQEEWDTDKTGTHQTFDSWSCNLELTMPICQKMTLAGEYFTGSNLDDYFGGVAQGVNSISKADLREIRSNGGWAALKFITNPSTTFSIGAGMDNPNDNDLTTMVDVRSKNQTIFASVIKKITPGFILGLQISDWQTKYKNAPDSNAFRAQTSLTYKF
ncbi:MAG: DcaP family trimeric outer membrane transporter [Chlorobium sp.]